MIEVKEMMPTKLIHDAVLEERCRIARDLHDSVAQAMAGVVLHLETARIQSSLEQWKHHTDRALDLARISMDEARRTVGELRRPANYEVDFISAFKEEAARQAFESQIQLIFEIKGTTVPIPEFIRSNIFRIGQEAIQNVIKHADATQILVSLIFNPEDMILRIKDNGCGFNVQSTRENNARFGLTGMRERTRIIRGSVEIRSQLNQGTEIILTVPLKA